MIMLEPLSFLMKEIFSEDGMLCHGNYGKNDKYWCFVIQYYHIILMLNVILITSNLANKIQKKSQTMFYVLSAQPVFNLTTGKEQVH